MYPLEIHCSAAVLSLENTNDSSDYRVPGKKKKIKSEGIKSAKIHLFIYVHYKSRY